MAPGTSSREADLARLAEPWDMIIVGGGITGAGILLEATRRGIKALLIEQRDFAWGTSSRSSKLVHGGLRYLKEGQLRLTRESVQERQQLLRSTAGLVEPQSFVFGDYQGRKPGRWLFSLGLAIYDQFAGERSRAYHRPADLLMLAPNISQRRLQGGMRYLDAKTDDARLVLRTLQEAKQYGGVAINYLRCESLLRDEQGVCGAQLVDALSGQAHTVNARVMVNATGAWADVLRQSLGQPKRLRPLRGSHLLFPYWRLPVAQAVSLMHPQDGRPVFIYPWEGVTLVGTTDLDHDDLSAEPRITPAEVSYLMSALAYQFPHLHLQPDDVLSTYAGVRPVVATGQADPSKEGRDHVCWLEDGLLTVSGGKLTTFRVIALDALKQAQTRLGRTLDLTPGPHFAPASPLPAGLDAHLKHRLQARYGPLANTAWADSLPTERHRIEGTDTYWLELRWAAQHESVAHLEDLLLRRTRLGLLLRHGGQSILPRVQAIVQATLGWDDDHWQAECERYLALIATHYSLPHEPIPPWPTPSD
ncbi:glycerol-3-phosphate dehydrogenase [Chitinivorax tropicus]|uniref:Glycerol-3-phosphate dehydrogenase n=1 Tax=Chitinivorax tropicus TaxID=714531 RepID=A0A840MK75_9PROT|nr:glycerol-3-phosphate dehydrogenase/oxidase [Chitinivorax tropicus]MBB5017559.1 glycerol-3-phosphate dehydrogenase [Chitinivorax tropicus]